MPKNRKTISIAEDTYKMFLDFKLQLSTEGKRQLSFDETLKEMIKRLRQGGK